MDHPLKTIVTSTFKLTLKDFTTRMQKNLPTLISPAPEVLF